MLTAYIDQTRRLLQNPPAPTTLYSDANLTAWINIARGQAAGEGECIRGIGLISTVVGQRNYDFASINLGVSANTGVAGIIHIRSVLYGVGTGSQWVTPRNWEWYQLYCLNNPVPTNGPPVTWAQFGQGAAAVAGRQGGSFYIDPPPDLVYGLSLDVVCYPNALTDDATVEAIPYLWTDAIPFFAAYYALLSSQTSTRQADAARMFEAYQTFMQRARQASNPSVNRYLYSQERDPTMISKLGLQQKANSGG